MENAKELQKAADQKKALHIILEILRNICLVIYGVFAIFPIFWMILMSLKSDSQVVTTIFKFAPTLENYKQVFFAPGSDYLRAFWQNILVSGGAVIVTVIAGVPAAYALARFEWKSKETWAFNILSFKFAPEILVVLPVFLIFQVLHLYDSYFGLIWVYQLITMPLLIWVVRGYFEDVSVEIEQAAQLDGYSWWQVFFKILMPLVKPGLVASGLLAFIFAWNEFTFPLILSGTKIVTITVTSIRYMSTAAIHYGQVAVAALVAAMPEIIVCLFIQNHLVRGLSFGAVQG
jgi:multiple sugar transport system permease protein